VTIFRTTKVFRLDCQRHGNRDLEFYGESDTQLVAGLSRIALAEVPSWNELKALTARVAWCRAIDAIRKQKAEKKGGGRVESLDELVIEPSSPVYKRPDEDLYHAELWRAYRECTQQLNPKAREVVELRLVDQLTQKEITDKLGIPQGTVGVMIMKTLAVIKDCLKARGFNPSRTNQ
jgi:RNA polymerase sigma factor (sigma-70 family)